MGARRLCNQRQLEPLQTHTHEEGGRQQLATRHRVALCLYLSLAPCLKKRESFNFPRSRKREGFTEKPVCSALKVPIITASIPVVYAKVLLSSYAVIIKESLIVGVAYDDAVGGAGVSASSNNCVMVI